MENKRNESKAQNEENLNEQQQAVDKSPGEERGEGEEVSKDDLKGKKVDADPERIPEQPIRQLP